jgi:Spy/CpxP family protein refolding chaperone
MKKMTQWAVLAGGAVLALAATRAATLADENPAKGDRMQHRIERMKEQLNLTDDQARQIEQIFREAHQQGQADREAMRERHKKVHDQIQSVLTPEQREKFAQMKKEHRGGRRHWKGGDKEKPSTTPSNPEK